MTPPSELPKAQAPIPTLLCINRGYAQHAAVLIVSLLENNKGVAFDVVVVSTEPLDAEEEKLRRTLGRYANCTLRLFFLTESSRFTLPVRAKHYTVDTYSRIWIAEYFPAEVTKALYLDGDMVVVGPIDALWNTHLGESVLAAVTIPGSIRCSALGIPERYGYFQSGVLLVNLARWRQEKVFDRLVDWIAMNPNKILDADQDVLNACLYDKRLPLPYFWNVIAPFYFNYHPLGIPEAERHEVTRRARIIHFNGPMKPWFYMSRHPRRAEYWKYLALTEWRDYEPGDRSIVNWGKKYVGPLVPELWRASLRRFCGRITD
jgi:lipopolysaccharide biosynthesis glycosyltransferase